MGERSITSAERLSNRIAPIPTLSTRLNDNCDEPLPAPPVEPAARNARPRRCATLGVITSDSEPVSTIIVNGPAPSSVAWISIRLSKSVNGTVVEVAGGASAVTAPSKTVAKKTGIVYCKLRASKGCGSRSSIV